MLSWLKKQQHNYALKKWDQLLLAIETNNSKDFWFLVAGALSNPSRPNDSSISSNQWATFYYSLFNPYPLMIASNDCLPPLDAPEWPPIRPEEIYDLIKNLKTGKASGSDGLPAELLMADIDW